jgi:hypothetical protein
MTPDSIEIWTRIIAELAIIFGAYWGTRARL